MSTFIQLAVGLGYYSLVIAYVVLLVKWVAMVKVMEMPSSKEMMRVFLALFLTVVAVIAVEEAGRYFLHHI